MPSVFCTFLRKVANTTGVSSSNKRQLDRELDKKRELLQQESERLEQRLEEEKQRSNEEREQRVREENFFLRFNTADIEEGLSSYRSGGHCPIDLGDRVLDRYRVLDKFGEREDPPQAISWLARDEQTSDLVQLEIFEAHSSRTFADSEPAKRFRNFANGLSGSATKCFQDVLHEGWVTSLNGEHLCRVLELGFVTSLKWDEKLSDENGYTAEEVREQALTLATGISQLHDRGFVHGNIKNDILVFTSTKVRKLSDEELLKLLGAPETVSAEDVTVHEGGPERKARLPCRMVFELDPTPFMEFEHATRIKAFPAQMRNAGKKSRRLPLNRSPESLFNESRPYQYSDDVWAFGCVIYELVTRIDPFVHHMTPEKAVFVLEEILGEIPIGLKNLWRTPPKPVYSDFDRPRVGGPLKKNLGKRLFMNPPCDSDFSVFGGEEHELLADLLERVFRYDPAKRPTMREVLEHPWFTSMGKIG
ncbi:MAG: hypothetical protein M1837_005667 [Sclerophora amabilis]|nr:MAG: hypothetical protein M1837_005667 [Sclerophora amabilis]